MTEHFGIDPELDPDEQRLGEELAARRPVPAAGFRRALGRRLAAEDPGYGPRPPRLRLAIAGWSSAGALLILAGALQGGGL